MTKLTSNEAAIIKKILDATIHYLKDEATKELMCRLRTRIQDDLSGDIDFMKIHMPTTGKKSKVEELLNL